MNTDHLTDMEIQQYLFDKENCQSQPIDHIEICVDCKARAKAYLLIASEIKNIQRPAFDFNLAELVLSRMPKPGTKFSFSVSLVYFLAFVSVALLCISFFLLQQYILNLLNDILPSFFYMMVVSAITVTIFQGIDMYRRFQNKMTRLNLY